MAKLLISSYKNGKVSFKSFKSKEAYGKYIDDYNAKLFKKLSGKK